MQTSLVVFNIAGTTVTDNDSVNIAFTRAFKKAGYPVVPAEINFIMGYRKIEAIKILLEKFYPGQVDNEALIQQIHNQFTEDMRAYYLETADLHPLPFAAETFRLLHANNIKIGLDTGFTKIITYTIMDRLGWIKNGLADVVLSSDEVPQRRPHASMIRAITNQLNLEDVKQVVKVGDTEVDIAEGRNAGCGLIVSVTTGSYSREELEQFSPDHIIGSLTKLPAILNLKA